MTTPTFFTVTGLWKSVVADQASDSDYNPQLGPVTATVTFTPVLNKGDVMLATTASPEPTGYLAAPVVARIDVDGRLKLRVDPDAGGTGTFTPVRLLCSDQEFLEIDGPLYYRVQFSEVRFNGQPGYINPFDFEAPSTDEEVNLIEVGRVPGQPAPGITRGVPGEDATITLGTVATGTAGSSVIVTNTGSSGAAIFNFTIPRGDTGATGQTGASGTAATIAVGTVQTGIPGSSATVTNSGTPTAAVFDLVIPRGDVGPTGAIGATGASGGTGATGGTGAVGATGPQGIQGPVGAQGIQGEAGVSLDIEGTVATYSALPANPVAGQAFLVADQGKLYYFDGTSFPSDGNGVAFVGPQGPVGPGGAAATIEVGTVTTGTAGSSASVTNVGTSTAAVFNITIPRGDVGASGGTGGVGATGETGSVGPTGPTGPAGPEGPVGASGGTGGVGATGASGLPGQAVNFQGSVATYSALPVSASNQDAFVVVADGLLYVYDSGWPAQGEGAPWVGAPGPTGPAGPVGATGAQGASGEPGSVGPTGPAGPVGATGPEGPVGATGGTGGPGATGPAGTTTWSGITDKPAVIAAGVDEAAARNVISAEYTANKGQANGYAALDSSGLVPSSQLPSFVDDVVEAANLAAFPGTGESGKIYTALDTNKVYRWGGSSYVEISASPGSTDAVPEGSTNLYYTAARADGRITAAVGSTVQAYSPTLTTYAGKTAPSGAVVGDTDTQTLTNKTISGSANTLSNIGVGSISASGTASASTFLRGDGTWSAGPVGASGASGATGASGGTGAPGASGASGVSYARNISTVTTDTTVGSAANTDYVVFVNVTNPDTTVVAMLNGNGSSNSTTITDGSSLASNWTAVGDAKLSTSTKKFGSASISFDGSGDAIRSTANLTNFTFGTSDWTVEMWAYGTAFSGDRILLDFRGGTGGATAPVFYAPNGALVYFTAGATRITGPTLSINTWYHIAVSRSGTSTRLFVDGVQQGSTYSDSNNYTVNNYVVVGNDGPLTAGWAGFVDDVRISKSARYTANFTPPSGELSADIGGTITLPSAVSSSSNQITVKNIHATATQSIATTSSQTIDGAAPSPLTAGSILRVVSDGSNWRTV